MDHAFEVMKICVVAYLLRIRESSNRAEYIREQIRRIESSITLRAQSYSEKLTGGSYADMTPETIEKLHQLRNELNDQISQSIDDFKIAFEICRDFQCRWAVWLHIVEGMTWEQIGNKLYMHKDTAYKLANQGYIEIYELMPEIEKNINIPNALPN